HRADIINRKLSAVEEIDPMEAGVMLGNVEPGSARPLNVETGSAHADVPEQAEGGTDKLPETENFLD
ncbi:MAG: hypothetical protein Q4E57_11590, partial [Eubacteriales bacterium]|nr:hypothetical protein [Eubacteriales bacterium]